MKLTLNDTLDFVSLHTLLHSHHIRLKHTTRKNTPQKFEVKLKKHSPLPPISTFDQLLSKL